KAIFVRFGILFIPRFDPYKIHQPRVFVSRQLVSGPH
ncbi:MAG: hypothetical protein ACI9RY_000111, partial [Reinekea sp.]